MLTLTFIVSNAVMSSQKIKFRVVYATGSDDDYDCSALEHHGPSIKGWRSERFCVYPQEMVLQLPGKIRIRKLQILVHQYLIPRRVELFIGTVRPGGSVSFQSATFTRLGYISFDSNEKTSFKARELKSVNLDCEGNFFKIQCHKNHINKLNIFNQVGIVAVNIIGDYIAEKENPSTFRELVGEIDTGIDAAAILGQLNRPGNISIVDDITFGVYQDPEIAKVIQQLEKKKLIAINEERYDYAKRLKQCINDLQRVGEKLGKLEQEKKAAVAEENFDVAQSKKVQANEIRVVIFEQLGIHKLLQEDRLRADDEPHILVKSPPHHLPGLKSISQSGLDREQMLTSRSNARSPSPDNVPLLPQHGPGLVDDRPIPTLSNKSVDPAEADPITTTPRDTDGPDEISLKQAQDLPQAVEVFGHINVACLFCKQFALRERGLNEILTAIKSNDDASNLTPKAIIQVYRQAFTDPVFNTLALALEMFKYSVTLNHFTKPQIEEICNATLPLLLKRCGEGPRVKQAITSLLLYLTDIPALKGRNCIHAITVLPCKIKNPKVKVGQLQLIECVLSKCGVNDKSSYSVDMVMGFVAPALSHTSSDVRDVAIRITLMMYKESGDPVRKFLPKDEPALRKKHLIWKKIFEEFDRIDGKPVGVPPSMSSDDQKALQVKALKAELAKLREMAANQNVEIGEQGKPEAKNKKKPKKEEEVPPESPSALAGDQLDHTCMFCNEHNDEFNAETLDVHFWKSCPMLRRCGICSQVIEIAGTTSHLLTECDASTKFEMCQTCKVAKPIGGPHKCAGYPKEDEALCPLCFQIVTDADESWRDHLMSRNGCANNPRRAK